MVNRLSEEQLDSLEESFNIFNQSGRGITKNELADVFRKYAKDIDGAQLDRIMEVADVKKTGYIDFYEFCLIFSH